MARPGTWRRAVALVTAQAMGHGECRSCPPTCPMHRPGKPRCHDAAHGGAHAQAPDRSPGCKLSQRGCGQHDGERAFELPPAILPPSELVLECASTPAPRPAASRVRGRNADPPETPPPVARG